MPGLAVFGGAVSGAETATSTFEKTVPADERSQIILDAGSLAVYFAAPPSYPLTVVRANGVTCALEGALYLDSQDRVAPALYDLASTFALDPSLARARAEAWSQSVDGDFILCVAGGAGALLVNDRLGRLPLYYSRIPGAAAVAREIKFIREFVGAPDVDRVAIAQMLLLSFPLGARTLHKNIKRLPEASSLTIDANGVLDVRSYYEWNFEALASEKPAPADAADRLADEFIDRCRALGTWANPRPLVVAMSGGLDSRAAAAGLSRAGHTYECVTFESERKGATEETATAQAIAGVLGAPWRLYNLPKPTWDAIAQFAVRTDGTMNAGMAFMQDFFARFRSDFGPDAIQVTGDGGDRALPDLTAMPSGAGRDAFVDERLGSALWPVETVAQLLRLDQRDIVDSVRAHVAAYPERGAAWWQARYMIADWGWRRIFSGEDRSRMLNGWTLTPFYCQSFFENAMRVPPHRKRGYALYARFLSRLDRRVASVKKSNWGYGPASPLVHVRALVDSLRHKMPPGLRKAFRGVRSGGREASVRNIGRTADPHFLAAIANRHNHVFDRAVLEEIARRGCGKTQYHMLLTAMMYVDAVSDAAAPQGAGAGSAEPRATR